MSKARKRAEHGDAAEWAPPASLDWTGDDDDWSGPGDLSSAFAAPDAENVESQTDPAAHPGMHADGRTNAEAQSATELSEFQIAARSVEAQMAQENDGEFYACVVFGSRSQRDAFFARCNVTVGEAAMVDGIALARAVHIPLPETPPTKRFRKGTQWAALPVITRATRPTG